MIYLQHYSNFVCVFNQTARQLGLDGIVREGVYTMVGGPNYETVAELKMLRELGEFIAQYLDHGEGCKKIN